MARHEIVIHENTGATREVAPYLGSYIAKETLQVPAFATALGNKRGLPAIQVIAILTGSFEAIEALERESRVRAWTDIGVVCAVITGSFPTADAAFDPARNALELALRLDDTLRLDLADTVPVIITDADLTKLRVDNVMDLEVERPMNLIHGQHVFRVAGFNMVLGDEGAAAYLENGIGTTFPLVIDHVTSHQLFTAHTAELLPAGDYKLVVKSRAGDAGGPLQTSFRKVKYLRVADPEPEPIAQTGDGRCKVMSFKDGDSATDFTFGNDWTLTGEGLFDIGAPDGEWEYDGAAFHVGAEDAIFRGVFETDGSSATLTPSPEQQITPGTYENVAFKYTVVRDGATETLTLTIPRLVVT